MEKQGKEEQERCREVEIGEEREVVGGCILVGRRVSGIGLLALSGFAVRTD